MIEQHSIETTRLSRGAALVGSGARVGVNYLKFYARRALSGKTDERTLHEENADEVYRTFSLRQSICPGPIFRAAAFLSACRADFSPRIRL